MLMVHILAGHPLWEVLGCRDLFHSWAGPFQAHRGLVRGHRDLLRVAGHAERSHRHRARERHLELEGRILGRSHIHRSCSHPGTGHTTGCIAGVEEADQRGTGAEEEVAEAGSRSPLGMPSARTSEALSCLTVIFLSIGGNSSLVLRGWSYVEKSFEWRVRIGDCLSEVRVRTSAESVGARATSM